MGSIDIFLSRATRTAPRFDEGLAGFTTLLATMGFNPRTLGTTDYPTKTPLDEIIALMDQCRGAIILGFPEIEVTTGLVLEQKADGLVLATEWNHIEAGIAYARDLPLLVIHHIGVSRGIFEHGALSNFIYGLDLTNPAWPLSPKITGALSTWKEQVLEPRSPGTAATTEEHRRVPLTDELLGVLALFVGAKRSHLFTSEVASHLRVDSQKALFLLERLYEQDLVSYQEIMMQGQRWHLTASGRTALVEHGKL